MYLCQPFLQKLILGFLFRSFYLLLPLFALYLSFQEFLHFFLPPLLFEGLLLLFPVVLVHVMLHNGVPDAQLRLVGGSWGHRSHLGVAGPPSGSIPVTLYFGEGGGPVNFVYLVRSLRNWTLRGIPLQSQSLGNSLIILQLHSSLLLTESLIACLFLANRRSSLSIAGFWASNSITSLRLSSPKACAFILF